MDTISKEEILKEMKQYILDNDDMFANVWENVLYDFVSRLTGIKQDDLEAYVNKTND